MEIKTREINGVQIPKELRYIELIFEYNGTELDCGLCDYKERIELAEHLKSVVDELLYGMEVSELNI